MKILFVCTGNIFRSVTAEYALRMFLGKDPIITISSAGTMHAPEATIRTDVAQYLGEKGLDVSKHRRRTLCERMLSESDIVISMSFDHRDTLKEQFQFESILFTEACGGEAKSLPDVDDLFPQDERHGPEAWIHIRQTIDAIVDQSYSMSKRLKGGWRGAI